MFLSGVCESNGWSSLLASWALCVLLGRKGYHCVGERSVTCLICVCLCECTSVLFRWNEKTAWQYQGWSISRLSCLCFHLPLSPILLHSHTFCCFSALSLRSPPLCLCHGISLWLFFLLHAISSYFCIFFLLPSLTLPASPPDNDREKECQSDGRRLPPWQDAGRTRSPFTR